jgi:hypothetical protein
VSAGLPIVEDPQRKAIKAAAIYYGSADVPQVRLDLPVLFVRAGLDQPLSNQIFDRTIAAGMAANAPWTVLNYPGGHHGFDVLDDNDLSREIYRGDIPASLSSQSPTPINPINSTFKGAIMAMRGHDVRTARMSSVLGPFGRASDGDSWRAAGGSFCLLMALSKMPWHNFSPAQTNLWSK